MNPQTRDQAPADDVRTAELLKESCDRLTAQLGRAIIGQQEVIEQLLLCILARGHAILEGVPGLAKTLMVSSLARCLELKFARIQFTPDLMPSDITGTEVLEEDRATGERAFRFIPGPIFAHLVLADEINRTPPKTQAALLEAMQERQVSAGGKRLAMPEPFFVLATQNPIEQEGTYPLPEAQQDRFMFKILVDYPGWDDEARIVELTTAEPELAPEPVLNAESICAFQHLVRRVPVAEQVIHYAMRLTRATRVGQAGADPWAQQYLRWGAGPRASQFLILAAKARAVLRGRVHVSSADVAAVARPVLRHRILPNFAAEAEGIGAEAILNRLIATLDPHAARRER